MDTSVNKIKLYITTALMTFMGVLSIQMSFLHTFMEDEFFNTASMVIFVLIVSGIFAAVVIFVKNKWIPAVIITVLLGLIVWMGFESIVGGFAEVIDSVASEYANYFGYGQLYLDISEEMIAEANPGMVCYLIIALLAYVFSLTIYHRKTIVIPIIFTVAALAAPVIVENNPSVFIMLYTVVYIIMLVMIGVSKSKKDNNTFVMQITAFITGVVLLIFGGIVSAFFPANEYEPKSFFLKLRQDLGLFIMDISKVVDDFEYIRPDNMPSSLGGGALGHLDELQFSGETVLEVSLPAIRDTVYIRGYIGQKYGRYTWEEPKVKDASLFFNMYEDNCTQQGMVAQYLQAKADAGELDYGIKGSMMIEYTSGLHRYDYSPLYSVVTKTIASSGDAALNKTDDGVWIEYFSPSSEELMVSEEYVYSLMEGTKYEYYSELYEDYVYKYYLDVNTPVADELNSMWGDYDVDTGEDRYKLACDINEYLDDNYTYTTEPGKVPADVDFVEYFLNETKQGYCTYFATAAVMMFRSAGVPARYVEGYSFSVTTNDTEIPDRDVTFYEDGTSGEYDYVKVQVKDSDAHAWVEYYVDGIGWVDFEVTPGNDEISHMPPQQGETQPEEPDSDESTPEETDTSKAPSESTPAESTTAKPDSGDDGIGEGGNKQNTINWAQFVKVLKLIGIIFAIIVPITTIILLIRYRRKKVEMELEAVYNYSGENRGRGIVICEYARFEKLMKYCGYVKESYMTEKEYAQYLGEKSQVVSCMEAQKLALWYERAQFSSEDLSEEEIIELRVIMEKIRERILGNIGGFKKFIFVHILNY